MVTSSRAPSAPTTSSSGYHRVRRGETLGRIARHYGVSVSQLKSWNGLRSDRIYVGSRLRVSVSGAARASGQRAGSTRTVSSRATTAVHEVRRGDTLWSVAARHGVEVNELKRWNNLRSSRIHPGQRLRIKGVTAPTSAVGGGNDVVSHRVQRGETLWSIARRYGVSVGDLARWNGQSTRQPIQVGQRLRVEVP